MSYRKNKYRQDIINRFGIEVGLPLFQYLAPENKAPSACRELAERRLKTAPRSLLVATETRKLGEMTAKADALRLANKQHKIYDTMYLRDDWTNTEIAEYMELPINQIVGRVYELRQMGLVTAAGKRTCNVTGMVVMAWRVK